MTLTADDIRAIVREELRPQRKPNKDRRKQIQCPVTAEEYALVQAAADQRDMCVADLVRLALGPVLNCELRRNRLIPVNVAKAHKRFREMKPDQLAAIAKDGVIASRMLARDRGAAVGQTAQPVPKLRGPSRPE